MNLPVKNVAPILPTFGLLFTLVNLGHSVISSDLTITTTPSGQNGQSSVNDSSAPVDNQTTQHPFLVDDYLTNSSYYYTTQSTNESLPNDNNSTNRSSSTLDPIEEQTNVTSIDPMAMAVHPWLPIGNFTGIIINDRSVNQSYYSYNYVYNPPLPLASQPVDFDSSSNDKATGNGEGKDSPTSPVNNSPASFDDFSPSLLDDSPTKEEDYAGGNYGLDEDSMVIEGVSNQGNPTGSREEEESLT